MKDRLLPFCLLAWLLVPAGVAQSQVLLGPAGDWHLFKGREEAPADWRSPAFDDSGWPAVPAPFYYGLPYTGTELKDMRGNYAGIYLRRTFTVTAATDIARLTLHTLSDDGFVAWLNGHEVARQNVPDGDLPHTATASLPVTEPPTTEDYPIQRPWELLSEGANVLTIQAFNVSLADSDDFAFAATLDGERDTQAPMVTSQLPVPGATLDALDTAEVFFSEPVIGVVASDLLVNGVPATEVERFSPDHFVFRFPTPFPGPVNFIWRAGHAITDDTGRRNVFAGGGWSVTLDPAAARAAMTIDEFMADDDRALLDEDKDHSDWIELHNGGSTPVKLLGWSLTDDATALGKWRFPDVTLAADARLIVFASQKNKTNVLGKLHTNFKLDPKGEYLALVAPDGQVVSDFGPKYPPQTRDVSYGRAPGAPDHVGYFTMPTPGQLNSSSGSGFAPAVTFSRPSGPFTFSTSVRLSAPGVGTVVRYTLDGSLPTAASAAFTDILRLTNTVQVRARAFAEGLLPGPPHSETYLRLSEIPVQSATFTSSLPVLVMSTFGKNIAGSVNTPVFFQLFEPVNGQTSLARPPTFTSRGGSKERGSSTSSLNKKSWAIQWTDEFDQDANKGILGMPSDSEWVLYAPNLYEPVFIHNPFMYELSRQTGRYASRTRFIEVYKNSGPLTSNQWQGIYVLEEKIGIGKHRVDIDKLQPEDRLAPEVTGGYLLKVDRVDPGDSGFNTGGDTIAYVDPKEPAIETLQRDPQEQYIRNYFSSFNKALNSVNWRDPVLGYAPYIDVDSWVDHHLLNVLSANPDCLVLSTYFHKPRGGKIIFGPIWDFDRTLGSTDGRDANPRAWGGGGSSFFFTYTWWGKLFQDPDFYQRYVDRYQELRAGGSFALTNLHGLVDRFANEVRPIAARESKKWSENRPRGGTYQAEVDRMKNWLSNRVDFIDSKLTQPPRITTGSGVVAPGTAVTLTGPVGAQIYYTLDGSDPRRLGATNLVSATAKLYSGAIIINADTRLTARAFDGTKRQVISDGPRLNTFWSRPVTASFTLQPSPMVVSELMFHPAAPPTGSPFNGGDFEFIELQNVSQRTVNLVGSHFTQGVQFTFTATNPVTQLAPGEHTLIVRDLAAFNSRYPGSTGVAGAYTGSLSGGGERLTLVGPIGEPWVDLSYRADWQPLADGPGFSLARSAAAADPNLATSWQRSTKPGGSPGQDESAPPVVPAVFVNEVLANPRAGDSDFVELANPAVAAVDIGGWWVSDDFGQPKRWRVPVGTTVPANGYAVLRKRELGADFALARTGAEVWIFSADAEGNLTGWVHGFRFGASENGVSFGRALLGTGEEIFTATSAATPGQRNTGPLVGPLVFDEIHFQPPPSNGVNDTASEFLDLRNLNGSPLLLADAFHPENTWHVRGGIEFDFPSNTIVPPAGHVVLVSFDPIRDTAALGRFRARYGLPLEALVFGPWRGSLANEGEGVSLLKPDEPDSAGVPHVLVEKVRYRAASPWPNDAAGTGRSLVRRSRELPGDQPTGWTSALPTPGADDADFDGLPDAWEVTQGLDAQSPIGEAGSEGDPDRDGFTNRQEYLNGTAPRDGSDALHPAVHLIDFGRARLTLAAPAGRAFLLQSSPTLAGDWLTVQTLTVPADGQIELPLPTATEGYYRLRPSP